MDPVPPQFQLSQAQTDALQKIKDTIGEHFDAGIVVILNNLENVNDASSDGFSISMTGHGGPIVGMGLLNAAQMQLARSIMFRNEP
jgi:hypothetical protein